MFRVEFANVNPAAGQNQLTPTSVRKRDLRQQSSRVALLSAMALAAAAGLGATDARADCVVAPNSVQCLTPTVTTNTQAPANAPNDRLYEGVGGQPLEVLVGAGVTVSGNGLSLLQSGGGSLNVVNNGVIGVDPGNAPSIVGDAALNLTTNGGSITYSGTGDIRNEGLGQGIDVFHNGTGAVTLDVGGKIVASGGAALTVSAGTSGIPAGDVTVRVTSVDADDGISLTNNSRVSGAVSLTATGPIRTNGQGVSAVASAGDVTVNVGEVAAGSGTGVGAFRANDGVGDITISAGAVSGSRGISASNTSVGAITVDATGPVTGTVDRGVQIQADGGVNLSFAGLVTGATDGMRIDVFDTSGDDIVVTSTAGFASLNGDAVVIDNQGLGDTDFNDSGPITASGGNGVSVTHAAISGDINVTTGDVTATDGVSNGIDIDSLSETGDVTVVANGAIRAGDVGIVALLGVDSQGDINITANGAIDGGRGIVARNAGTGAVSATADQRITATLGEGIEVKSQGAATVKVEDVVTGATGGVSVVGGSGGTGDISVSGAGSVIGLNGDGVTILNEGAGTVTFDVTGPISSTNGNGVIIRDSAVGGDIFVRTGNITVDAGNGDGIRISSDSEVANISVSAEGDIHTVDGVGIDVDLNADLAAGDIVVNARGITSQATGILAETDGSGSISINAAGPIVSAGVGIEADTRGGDITVVSAGTITTDSTGIDAESFLGHINVTATGAINAANGIVAETIGDVSVTTTETITASDNGMILESGFGRVDVNVAAITAQNGVGLSVDHGEGGGDVAIKVNGLITGAKALDIDNFGTGDISVTGAGGFASLNGDAVTIFNEEASVITYDVSGPVTATNGRGIVIEDTSAGEGMTVTTGAVTADNDAITLNSGSLAGDLSLVANGDIRSNGEGGISATLTNVTSTGDISITANRAVSGTFGVVGSTRGSGSVNVTTTGLVTATDGGGVFAETTGGAINVTTGAVTGTDFGINAQQIGSGTGAISVTANGAVTAAQNEGIIAVGNGAVSVVADGTVTGEVGVTILGGRGGAGDLSLTGVGAIVGLDGNATNILNSGTGTVTFDVSGPITATNGNGVFIRDASGGGDINVTTGAITATTATFNAVNVVSNSTTADVNVVANGVLKGGNWGVIADLNAGAAAGDVSVVTNAAIEAGQGIRARTFGSGDVAVLAAGPITATTGFGVEAQTAGGAIDITTGGVTSAGVGVSARHVGGGTGAISITTNGAVNSTASFGVVITGNGAVTFDGTGLVSGERGLAIAAGLGGSGDITVTGAGGFTGRNNDGAFILNSGSGSVSFNNSGPITATNGQGLDIRAGAIGGDVRVTTGAVTANSDTTFNAIRILSQSLAGDIGVVTNGVLKGGNWGVQAQLQNAGATGDITVTSNAAVESRQGLQALNFGTGSVAVVAAAPVTATGGVGVQAQTAGGTINIATGAVTSTGIGISALQTASAAGVIAVASTGAVDSSGANGVVLDGRNTVSFSGGGLVSGQSGIVIRGGLAGGGDISLTGAGGAVGRVSHAADILNNGSGSVLVDVTGALTGSGGAGLLVRDTAAGGDIRVTTGAATAVGTAFNAIDVLSASTGADVNIVSNGVLTAGNWGVFTRLLSGTATGDMFVTTNAAINARQGILATTVGTGSVAITAAAPITANGGAGVQARTAGGAISVSTGAVTSTNDAVEASHTASGAGAISVTATGPIRATGANARGILASSRGAGVTVAAGDVQGGLAGIVAVKSGGGAGDVRVTAANVSGGVGVAATNEGPGVLAITTTGAVTGTAGEGVQATTSGNAGDLQLDVRDARGTTSGVSTGNSGLGATNILVRGTAEGARNGVNAFSNAAQAVNIRNEGTVRNSSGASSAIALAASGGAVNVTNAGTLHGGVILSAGSSRFSNEGSWNSIGGDSVFTGGDDRLTNAVGGSILGGSTAAVLDRTTWQGLESFDNGGRITLSDGGGGDVIATSANSRFLTGSTFDIDLDGAKGSDMFFTTGTLSIAAGVGLNLNIIEPLALNTRYVVAQADGGLTGQFQFEDRAITAFLTLSDSYNATQAFLELSQTRTLASAAISFNQKAVAAAADRLAENNAVRFALTLLPDDAAANDAFDQLSGEVHPAARRAMADDSRLARDAVLDRLDESRAEGSVWGRAFLEERITDADPNAASMDRDTRGVMFGADRTLGDSLVVGVAASRFDTSLDIDSRHSTATIRTTQGLAYIGGRLGQWELKAGVGYAENATHTERQVAFPGFSASPQARYDGSVLQGFLDAGYRIPLQTGFLEPFGSLTTVRAETDAFQESGGLAALAGEANTDDLTISTLGLRFGTGRVGVLSLRGSAGWRSLSGDRDPDGRHAFGAASTFTVLGAVQSDQAAVADVEAEWRLAPNVTLGLAYDGVMGTEGEDHAIRGAFRIAF